MIEPILLQLGPGTIVKTIINGLGQAGQYVILASGLTLIFGLMGVLNFAHGATITIGTYLTALVLLLFSSANATGMTPFVALFASIAVVFVATAALGAVIEYGLIRKLYDRPPIDQILLTFGIATVLTQLTEIMVNTLAQGSTRATTQWRELKSSYGPGFLRSTVELPGGYEIPGIVFVEIIAGAIVVVAVWAFLTRTRYGLYIRAGSEDDEMAEALGINIRRVFTVVFAIGSGLAGLAGLFLIWEPTTKVTIAIGAKALLPAFIVVVVGGLGTFTGTVAAAVVAGFFYEFGVQVSTAVQFVTLPEMLLFILLVGVLIFRPTGLLGEAEVGGH